MALNQGAFPAEPAVAFILGSGEIPLLDKNLATGPTVPLAVKFQTFSGP